MIDVEIEPHADRVGGDQIVDVAGLIERDLRVSGARRERAQHHRRAAALAADQLGDGIDLLGRERHDGGAARQPRDLLLAREGELRQPRPRQHMRARQQPLDHRPHGLRAEHQRLLAPAAIEHAVGEDMAALEIGAELHLVDRQEGDVEIARHRLDGRDPVARVRRLDLLLAGDQRDRLGADPLHHLVVDLARQQPQRQPDDARRVAEHALDGEMGLAGIGRPEHRGDAGAAGAGFAAGRRGGRGEGDGHRRSKVWGEWRCGKVNRAAHNAQIGARRLAERAAPISDKKPQIGRWHSGRGIGHQVNMVQIRATACQLRPATFLHCYHLLCTTMRRGKGL